MMLSECNKLTETRLLTETTPVSAPEFVLGREIIDALYSYIEQIKYQIGEEEKRGDQQGVAGAKLWLQKFTEAMEKFEEEDYGDLILTKLGLDQFNPYYPDR